MGADESPSRFHSDEKNLFPFLRGVCFVCGELQSSVRSTLMVIYMLLSLFLYSAAYRLVSSNKSQQHKLAMVHFPLKIQFLLREFNMKTIFFISRKNST